MAFRGDINFRPAKLIDRDIRGELLMINYSKFLALTATSKQKLIPIHLFFLHSFKKIKKKNKMNIFDPKSITNNETCKT